MSLLFQGLEYWTFKLTFRFRFSPIAFFFLLEMDEENFSFWPEETAADEGMKKSGVLKDE